ncbi:MAG: pyrroline-5-carboxylate reductase [Brachymonas sp.]|jgi:pyrroline-5-carboxylate reductase
MQFAFIGGGNMASAIIAGLIKNGAAASSIQVVEPYAPQREKLAQDFAGIVLHEQAGSALQSAQLVVWAVKPQVFQEVAAQTARFVSQALHLSVAAGINSDSLAAWLGSQRIVRAMPNTPALVGLGMTGLFARAGVGAADKTAVEQAIAATGQYLWVAHEADLDAVTAVSGSGPAYVFYFMEAMMAAGQELGLSAAQAKQLTLATFNGATQLAATSPESPAILRERVTSKGGTTYAALSHMQAADIAANIAQAMHKAAARSAELGQEFGK